MSLTNSVTVSTKIKNVFNNISLTRGDIVNIATCDKNGIPNVTPIGSMRIVNDTTVHVLQGLLPKTYSNLKENPRATFVITKKFKIYSMFKELINKQSEPLGYRIYCSFTGSDDSKDVLENEFTYLLHRFPFFLRKFVMSFMKKTLQRLLIFRIENIREVK
jgi:hypothetical protein